MVFGSNYCAVSRLEIKDGDKCILVPLGFKLKSDFDRNCKADINMFFWLYYFVPVEPQEVIYNGNVADLTYLDPDYETLHEHEMFMLIHLGFWKSLHANFRPTPVISGDTAWRIRDLQLFDTFWEVWEKAQEYEDSFRDTWFGKLHKKEISRDEYVAATMKGAEAPEWMVRLHRLGSFMGMMGIMATPNICNDQHEMGTEYDKLVSLAKKYDVGAESKTKKESRRKKK